MRIKILLAILSCTVMPVFFVMVLGVLQGAWFDVEEVIQRPEYAEMNMYKHWQYCVFYIVMAIMSFFEFLIVYFYAIKGSKSIIEFIFGSKSMIELMLKFIAGITIFVWCSIAAIFIVTTGYDTMVPLYG